MAQTASTEPHLIMSPRIRRCAWLRCLASSPTAEFRCRKMPLLSMRLYDRFVTAATDLRFRYPEQESRHIAVVYQNQFFIVDAYHAGTSKYVYWLS